MTSPDGAGRGRDRGLAAVLALIGILAFAILLGSTALGVVVRYLIAHGFEWSYEVAGFAFIWVSVFGVLLAEARGENVAFDSIDRLLSPAWRRRTAVLRAVLLCLLGLALLGSGLAMLMQSGLTPSLVLRWPKAVVVLAMPLLGLGLVAFGIDALRHRP